jgi:hypothetical protein
VAAEQRSKYVFGNGLLMAEAVAQAATGGQQGWFDGIGSGRWRVIELQSVQSGHLGLQPNADEHIGLCECIDCSACRQVIIEGVDLMAAANEVLEARPELRRVLAVKDDAQSSGGHTVSGFSQLEGFGQKNKG